MYTHLGLNKAFDSGLGNRYSVKQIYECHAVLTRPSGQLILIYFLSSFRRCVFHNCLSHECFSLAHAHHKFLMQSGNVTLNWLVVFWWHFIGQLLDVIICFSNQYSNHRTTTVITTSSRDHRLQYSHSYMHSKLILTSLYTLHPHATRYIADGLVLWPELICSTLYIFFVKTVSIYSLARSQSDMSFSRLVLELPDITDNLSAVYAMLCITS